MSLPTLLLITGPPGTGKTTLAHELGRALPFRMPSGVRGSRLRWSGHWFGSSGCAVAPELASERVQQRLQEHGATRRAHADAALAGQAPGGESASALFQPLTLKGLLLEVDTTAGYRPGLDEIAAFARGH